MKKYQFNKLIRSKLPARMIDEGVSINSSKLSVNDYIMQLKNKIVEEAKEVLHAKNNEHLTIELADVLEVIYAISEASNINIEDIEKARLEKRNVNGHFEADNYIHYIKVAEDNHKVIEYLNNKDRPYKLNQ